MLQLNLIKIIVFLNHFLIHKTDALTIFVWYNKCTYKIDLERTEYYARKSTIYRKN